MVIRYCGTSIADKSCRVALILMALIVAKAVPSSFLLSLSVVRLSVVTSGGGGVLGDSFFDVGSLWG